MAEQQLADCIPWPASDMAGALQWLALEMRAYRGDLYQTACDLALGDGERARCIAQAQRLESFANLVERLAVQARQQVRKPKAKADVQAPKQTTSAAPEGYISTSEAARRSGLSTSGICYLVRRGVLPGCKVGRSWMVQQTAVEQYRQPGYVAVKVAAAQLGKSVYQVRDYLSEGELTGVKRGGKWFVSEAAIRDFLERHPDHPKAGPVEPPDGYLTTWEAARRSGLSRLALCDLLRRGTLAGVKRERLWFIPAAEVERLCQKRVVTPPEIERYVSAVEAAKRLGVGKQTVHRWVASGRLAGMQLGRLNNTWAISEKSIDAYLTSVAQTQQEQAERKEIGDGFVSGRFGNYLTIAATCERLYRCGITLGGNDVVTLLEQGQLRGQRYGGCDWVDRDSLRDYIETTLSQKAAGEESTNNPDGDPGDVTRRVALRPKPDGDRYEWVVICDPTRKNDEPGDFYGGRFRILDLRVSAAKMDWPEGIAFRNARTGQHLVYQAGSLVQT